MSRTTSTALVMWIACTGAPVDSTAQPEDGLPPASVAVSPPRVEVDLDAARSTESIQIINLSDKETKLSVAVTHWDLDESNKVRDIPPTEQSLDQWIVINPLEFTIPPNEQQTIRFAIRPRVKPEPGEHRAMIYFEQEPGDPTSAAQVSVRYRLGVAVYGLSGHIDRRGRIRAIRHSRSGEDHFLDVDTISEGNASVRLTGQYAIWQADEFPGEEAAAALLHPRSTSTEGTLGAIGVLPEIPILPGTERTVRARLPMVPNERSHILYVNGEVAGRPFSETLEIPAP